MLHDLSLSSSKTVAFGRFRLIKRLALGESSEIYVAHDTENSDDELVVIKRLLPHVVDRAEAVQTFGDEFRIAESLAHPHIVRVIDTGEYDEHHYLSMELLEGVDLKRLFEEFAAKGEGVPVAVVFNVVISVASALGYAHDKRDRDGKPMSILHRDVSPTNIVLTFHGLPKLFDFGTARAVNAMHKTKTGAAVGKLGYIAPEQARVGDVDRRSDVFSLGVVMWELVTGRRLYNAERDGHVSVYKRLCSEPIAIPSKFVDCDPEVDRIVMRALAKDPAERFPDAHTFRSDLEQTAQRLGLDVSAKATADALVHRLGDMVIEERTKIQELRRRASRKSTENPAGDPEWPTDSGRSADGIRKMIADKRDSAGAGVGAPGPHSPPTPDPRVARPKSDPRVARPKSDPRMRRLRSEPRLARPSSTPRTPRPGTVGFRRESERMRKHGGHEWAFVVIGALVLVGGAVLLAFLLT